MVDSTLNKDPKNVIFFQEGPNLAEELSENLGKIGNNGNIYFYTNWWVANFEGEYQSLPPWYQNARVSPLRVTLKFKCVSLKRNIVLLWWF